MGSFACYLEALTVLMFPLCCIPTLISFKHPWWSCVQVGLAVPLASVNLIPEHGVGSSDSLRHVELTGAIEPDEWEIDAEELELGPRIGIGSFGEVYRGTWRHTDVAVKKFLEQDLSPQLMQVCNLAVPSAAYLCMLFAAAAAAAGGPTC